MKKISVIGMGYVGLVTAASLAHNGHQVTCIEKDEQKVEKLRQGKSPIYEPGLEELIQQGLKEGKLLVTTDSKQGFQDVDIIFIAVGTPTLDNGAVDLSYIDRAIEEIALGITRNVIVVTKSTVPVGTNEILKRKLTDNLPPNIGVTIVSNPEFLREGSAIHDTFHADRIIIGADNETASNEIAKIYKPFGIPIYQTDLKSAEMIKYASNAFLATKISFINEIANICEKLGADVESVSKGMGMDERIGSLFLQAGIGYGGSCFPKDTKALSQIAANVEHDFHLLKAVIEVNNSQQTILLKKARDRFGSLKGKKAAILGLSFKPNTDDMRESPSIVMTEELLNEGSEVMAFDPVISDNAKNFLPQGITFKNSIESVLMDTDMVFILTDWDQIIETDLMVFAIHMVQPIIFDGRNCFSLEEIQKFPLEYHSIGRKTINNLK